MTHTFTGTQPALAGTLTPPIRPFHWPIDTLLDTQSDTHFNFYLFCKIKKDLATRILSHNCSVILTFSFIRLTNEAALHKTEKLVFPLRPIFFNPENCVL